MKNKITRAADHNSRRQFIKKVGMGILATSAYTIISMTPFSCKKIRTLQTMAATDVQVATLPSPSARNILIRRVDNLGDIVLVMPALKMLRNHFKDANITLMVKPEHRVLVKQYADNFLSPVPLDDFKMLSEFYEHCINIEYSLPQNIKPVADPLPKIIHVGGRNWHRPQHIAKRITSAVKAYGIKGVHKKQKLLIEAEAKNTAAKWLAERKLNTTSNFIVSVDPNCGFPKKSWLLSGFIEVCKYLTEQFNAVIIIPTHSETDKRVVKLKNSLPAEKSFILAGKPLDIVASILSKCDLHIGNDSGIGHLASAINIPTVTVFGPTDPFLWKPAGKKAVVIHKPEENCPGGYEHASECKIQRCLLSIKTDEVIDGILYTITKHVKQKKLYSLFDFTLSKYFTLKKTTKGYILRNSRTGHSCIVKDGWLNIKMVLKQIKAKKSAAGLLMQQPHQKLLVDMLIMHRLLEPYRKSI